MGHYPIKCIYCMQPMSAEDRCIKRDNETIYQFDATNFGNTGRGGQSNVDMLGDISLSDDLGGSGVRGPKGNRIRMVNARHVVNPYKPLKEIRDYITKRKVEDIYITNEYKESKDPEISYAAIEEFTSEIEVKDLPLDEEGGETISGTTNQFFCPYCHEALIPQAGFMPIYMVSLMGPSSAGKTVFLTILRAMLEFYRIYPLPVGELRFESLDEVGQEYASYLDAINYQNKLPATTQEARKEPYLVEISYAVDREKSFANKKCVVALIDMRGEYWTNRDYEAEMRQYMVPQFKFSDSFLMLVDPETLEGVYNVFPENLLQLPVRELQNKLNIMKSTIRHFQINRISKPSVVALVKQDILVRYHRELGIEYSDPVVAPNFRPIAGTSPGQSYYNPMNTYTKNCIQRLSPGFAHYLDQLLDNPHYVSVSALGPRVRILSGNRLENSAEISPVRVEEPLIRLLMKLNFIPDFANSHFDVNPQAFINNYLRYFGEIEETKVVEEKAPGGKKKRFGLFNRQ